MLETLGAWRISLLERTLEERVSKGRETSSSLTGRNHFSMVEIGENI